MTGGILAAVLLGAGGADLPTAFERIWELARREPRAAFQAAAGLEARHQRDHIERLTWRAVAGADPEAALARLPALLERPWVGEVNLADALPLVRRLVPASEGAAGRLLTEVCREQASLAVRNWEGYHGLPGGAAAFAEAVRLTPEEAALVAAGGSPAGAKLRRALAGAEERDLQVLAELAEHRHWPAPVVGRLAVLHRLLADGTLTMAAAARVSSDAWFFSTLAARRRRGLPGEVVALDRALAREALALARQGNAGTLGQLALPDLATLLAYARPEEDERFFGIILDRVFLARLRREGRSLGAVLEAGGKLRLRDLFSAALAEGRLAALLGVARDGRERNALLTAVLADLEGDDSSLQDAAAVAELLVETAAPTTTRAWAEAIAAGHERSTRERRARGAALHGLLAALLVQRAGRALAPDDPLHGVAAPYQRWIQTGQEFDASALYRGGRCLELHCFYDDPDGAESYASFRSAHPAGSGWQAEEQDGYVVLRRRGAEGRILEIVANVPLDLRRPENAGRDAEAERRHRAVTAWLEQQGRRPAVVVHRGHAYHLERTLSRIPLDAKFVFLGGCRGVREIHQVLGNAPRAEVIATRAAGTERINDPLLAVLHEEILKENPILRWPAFWRPFEARFGSAGVFGAYVPPHRNPAAVFVRAYYAWLIEG